MDDTPALRRRKRQHCFSVRPVVVYDAFVIKRFYVHNFRCLENFELPISGRSSTLLIGNNGSGKTTVGLALEVLQRIARGTNRVGDLVKPKDFLLGRTDVPMRFEIEVELESQDFRLRGRFRTSRGVQGTSRARRKAHR